MKTDTLIKLELTSITIILWDFGNITINLQLKSNIKL